MVKVVSGYSGGHKDNPTYEEVSSGTTGHMEAVQISYDPSRISYEQLLNYYWKHIDPTDPAGQFVDRGSQYRTIIFYHDDEQKRLAEKSRQELEQSGKFDRPIATQIIKFTKFWPAEDYHQDFDKKNLTRYVFYRMSTGRDAFAEKLWGKAPANKKAAK